MGRSSRWDVPADSPYRERSNVLKVLYGEWPMIPELGIVAIFHPIPLGHLWNHFRSITSFLGPYALVITVIEFDN
jgi:hypothetical protein